MEPDSNKKRNPLQSLGFALSTIAIASVIAATAYAYKAHKEAQSEINAALGFFFYGECKFVLSINNASRK